LSEESDENKRDVLEERRCPRCGDLLIEEEYDGTEVLCASKLTPEEEQDLTSFDDVSVLNTFGLPLDRERQFMKGSAKLWSCENQKNPHIGLPQTLHFLEFPDGTWYELDGEDGEWKECLMHRLAHVVLGRSQKTLGKWVGKRKEKSQNRRSKVEEQKPNKGRKL